MAYGGPGAGDAVAGKPYGVSQLGSYAPGMFIVVSEPGRPKPWLLIPAIESDGPDSPREFARWVAISLDSGFWPSGFEGSRDEGPAGDSWDSC